MPKKDGSVHHVLVDDVRSLLWVVNQNTITPHVWVSRVPRLHHPDVCVFDLDPMEDDPQTLRGAALRLRELAPRARSPQLGQDLRLEGLPHRRAARRQLADRGRGPVRARRRATLLVSRDPDHLTQEFSKKDRGRRILIDTGRNGYSATFAAAYAVRARPGAPVSAPCTWKEIEDGTVEPTTFSLRNMAERVAAVKDLWEEMPAAAQPLKEAVARLKRLRKDAAISRGGRGRGAWRS